jgi:hypothetical protein
LIISSFVVNYRTRKLMIRSGDRGVFLSLMARSLDAGMIGFLVSAFFVTVLFYPFLWFNLAITAAIHESAKVVASQAPGGAALPSAAPARVSGWRTARSLGASR